MNWEYLVITIEVEVPNYRDDNVLTAFLNTLGLQQWKLACIDDNGRYVFARELPPVP